MSQHQPLRVCYFGTYRQEYSRNRILIQGLRSCGVEVIECQSPLWQSTDERVDTVTGGWKSVRFWSHLFATYGSLLRKFFALNNQFDVLCVGYPGQFDVYLARILSWWSGKPLVWDVFMSIYLIACERGLQQKSPITVRFLRMVERLALRLPHRLILDTDAYVTWFGKTHGVPAHCFRLVPTGADDQIFRPRLLSAVDESSQRAVTRFTVLYYGSFIPNHGVSTILGAATLLRQQSDIHFLLIGDGPERAKIEAESQRLVLTNITFVDWLDSSALQAQIASADLCLGAFGTTPQSLMTIQNKIYEGLACRRTVVSGESATVRQTFEHGKEIYLCERNHPESLAEAIETLKADPELRRNIAEAGHRRFQAEFTVEKLGERFKQHLLEILGTEQ